GLVGAPARGGRVHLGKAEAGGVRGELRGDGCRVTALAFTPDGKRLLAGRADSTAIVWDLTALPPPAQARKGGLTAAELEALWGDLGGDAGKGFRAIHALAGSPREAVPFLQERVRPVPPVEPGPLDRLIADLGNGRFAARPKA